MKVSSHFLLHVVQIVMEHLFRKLCARWVPKQLIPEHRAKDGVSINISAVVPWWQWWVCGPDHHRWWNVGCTHYPRNQAAVNPLVSQWISLQDKIQADIVGAESDVHSALGQTDILIVYLLTRGKTVNAELYCKALQKPRWGVQNKRCRMISANIVLLHDNISPHTAQWSIHLQQFTL